MILSRQYVGKLQLLKHQAAHLFGNQRRWWPLLSCSTHSRRFIELGECLSSVHIFWGALWSCHWLMALHVCTSPVLLTTDSLSFLIKCTWSPSKMEPSREMREPDRFIPEIAKGHAIVSIFNLGLLDLFLMAGWYSLINWEDRMSVVGKMYLGNHLFQCNGTISRWIYVVMNKVLPFI